MSICPQFWINAGSTHLIMGLKSARKNLMKVVGCTMKSAFRFFLKLQRGKVDDNQRHEKSKAYLVGSNLLAVEIAVGLTHPTKTGFVLAVEPVMKIHQGVIICDVLVERSFDISSGSKTC